MDDGPAPRTLTEPQEWVRAICAVTGWNVALNAGRAARFAKALRTAGATWQELEAHYGQTDRGAAWWWYRDQWQGAKLGQRPTQAQITETWGAWSLPIALRPCSAVGGMLAYIERLEQDEHTKRDG